MIHIKHGHQVKHRDLVWRMIQSIEIVFQTLCAVPRKTIDWILFDNCLGRIRRRFTIVANCFCVFCLIVCFWSKKVRSSLASTIVASTQAFRFSKVFFLRKTVYSILPVSKAAENNALHFGKCHCSFIFQSNIAHIFPPIKTALYFRSSLLFFYISNHTSFVCSVVCCFRSCYCLRYRYAAIVLVPVPHSHNVAI